MSSIYRKVIGKMEDVIVTEVISVAFYVGGWCWNQAGVQQVRRKLELLLFKLSLRLDHTADQQNTVNGQVRELLRQLKDEVEQVIILLGGEPTPSDVSNAMEGLKKIQIISLEIIDSMDPKIKPTQFNPCYLHRRTRCQDIVHMNIFFSSNLIVQLYMAVSILRSSRLNSTLVVFAAALGVKFYVAVSILRSRRLNSTLVVFAAALGFKLCGCNF